MDERKTVYVGDIVNNVEVDFLKSFFGPDSGFGEIYSLILNTRSKKTKNNKYAFITYGSQEEAEKVVRELNSTKLNGFPIRVSLAQPNFQKIKWGKHLHSQS